MKTYECKVVTITCIGRPAGWKHEAGGTYEVRGLVLPDGRLLVQNAEQGDELYASEDEYEPHGYDEVKSIEPTEATQVITLDELIVADEGLRANGLTLLTAEDYGGGPESHTLEMQDGRLFRLTHLLPANTEDERCFVNDASLVAWAQRDDGTRLVIGMVTTEEFVRILAASVVDGCLEGMWPGETELLFHGIKACGVDTSTNEDDFEAWATRRGVADEERAALLKLYRDAYEARMLEAVAAWAVRPVHCDCGTWTGVRCEWHGTMAQAVVVEYMPEHLRTSHEKAGNRGVFPVNGALRVYCSPDCAQLAEETDTKWTEVIAGPEWF